MSTIAERLEAATVLEEAAAAKSTTDSGLLHEIVHRPYNGADVTTEGGNVKPVAKVIAQCQTQIDAMQAGGGLYSRVAFPANTAASGALGQFSIDGPSGELAIYVVGTGWLFYTGFTK